MKEKQIDQIGKLCLLCKKGITQWVNLNVSVLMGGSVKFEGTSCSNDDCSANVKL